MALPSGMDESAKRILELLSNNGNIVVTEPPKLDLESYIQNYSGRTRWTRLMFIAHHSVTLCVDALKAAVVEAKNGRDRIRYIQAQEKLAFIAPNEPEAKFDKQWVDSTVRENAAKARRLEDELKGYKNNLIKESIRMGNEDLGIFYQVIGDLEKAYEAFTRMKSDIIIQKHIVDVSRHLISVCIEQGKWMMVQSNVAKIMQGVQPAEESKALQPMLQICRGLVGLAEGKFYDAALDFLAVESGMGSTYNDIATPNDVAIYGGLCALASMDRVELQKRVLENSNFRTYLELEPHIRRAVAFFVNGRYSACLSTLEAYRDDYLLDIYLHRHVYDIYQRIRSKCIIQYFIPFSCVTLDSMDAAFGTHGQPIEQELVQMIEHGTLEARIDKQNRLLTSVPSLPRAALHTHTLASVETYEKEMRHRLLRMNILGAGLEVRSGRKNNLVGSSGWLGQISGREDIIDSGSRRRRVMHDGPAEYE